MDRYKKKGNQFYANKIKDFKKNSNTIKENIYKTSDNYGKITMEFGAGLLNDLSRWSGIKKVYAIEIDPYSIEIGIRRYERLKKDGQKLPEVVYIQADLSKDKIYENKKIEKVDIIYSMFSFHYFLGSKESFENIKKIINYFLKPLGKLYILGLNGKKIFNELYNRKIIDLKDDNFKYTLFKIEKLYTSDKFENFGQKIKVFVISIGIAHEEYLVNDLFLLENLGLKIIEKKNFPLIFNLSESEKKYNSFNRILVYEKS